MSDYLMKNFFTIVLLLFCFMSSSAGAEDTAIATIAKRCNIVETCTPLAESDDVEAQLRLVLIHTMKRSAFLFSEDKLSKQNLKEEAEEARKNADRHGAEILKWLQMAEKQEDVRAFAQLGRLYARGEIVAKDERKAADYYTKAAQAGDWLSQHQLGEFYYAGRGVEKSRLMAYVWLNCALKRSAAQKGSGTISKRERIEYLLSAISKEWDVVQIKEAQELANQYILDFVAPFQPMETK
jgi:TPR repeat protein